MKAFEGKGCLTSGAASGIGAAIARRMAEDSVVAGTRADSEAMRKQRSGKIINTCSMAGKTAWAETALYCASKLAVRGFTIAFARELAPHGIHVDAICPGMVQTLLWDDFADQQRQAGVTDTHGEALVKSYALGVALERHALPDDIVGLAMFLASPDSDYITGRCINVDGGLVLT